MKNIYKNYDQIIENLVYTEDDEINFKQSNGNFIEYVLNFNKLENQQSE